MKTEPNWNEAPEGATHYWLGEHVKDKWHKLCHDGWYFFDHMLDDWIKLTVCLDDFPDHMLASRPTVNQQLTVPVVNDSFTTEWDGQGLPPVGTVCEASRFGEWVECRIENHLKCYKKSNLSTDVIFSYKLASGKPEWYWHDGSDCSKFRPLKTERDRWITEGKKASSDILSSRQLGQIYDAGLAKLPD